MAISTVAIAVIAYLLYQAYQTVLEEKNKQVIIENCQATAQKRAYDVWLTKMSELNLQYPNLSESLKGVDVQPQGTPVYEDAYKKYFDNCLETATKIKRL